MIESFESQVLAHHFALLLLAESRDKGLYAKMFFPDLALEKWPLGKHIWF